MLAGKEKTKRLLLRLSMKVRLRAARDGASEEDWKELGMMGEMERRKMAKRNEASRLFARSCPLPERA